MEKTMKTGKVGTLGAESRFTYGGVEWVALESRPNMVLALAADVLKDGEGNTRYMPFDEDNKNDFAAASVRAFLNGDFLEELAAAGADKDAFVPIVLDLTSDDGLDDYGTDTVKIGLITDQMYRRFRGIIPNASDWWWTCTPFSTARNGNSYVVRSVLSSGALSYSSAYGGLRGVRPLCCLKSSILASYDEDQIKERTPSIGETLANMFMDGLKEALSGEGGNKEPENATKEPPAEDQRDDEARRRGEAVDMMKHIAAAFDIPAKRRKKTIRRATPKSFTAFMPPFLPRALRSRRRGKSSCKRSRRSNRKGAAATRRRPYTLYIRKDWFRMSAFEFMTAAFYALVGVACLAVAVVIVYAVAVGIYRGLKGGGGNGRK